MHENLISDIEPLVINQGIAGGDYVYLDNNPLDYTSINVYIPVLEQRGVGVSYTIPQLPPEAHDDSYNVTRDTELSVTAPGVLENDVDVNNDAFTANLVADVINGVLTFNSDGSFTYISDAGFVGTDSFTYVANDGYGDSNIATVYLVVAENEPPTAVATASEYVICVNSEVTFDGSGSSDPDNNIVSYDWSFGDEQTGSGITANHTYTASGIYEITLTVTDEYQETATDIIQVVVYDPDGGYVTGNGEIVPGSVTSDADDYLPGLDGSSTADFGFVAKYKHGATTPTNQLEFDYIAGNFNLQSDSIDWLVIVNDNWAKFRGTATIQGMGGLYSFQVDARDGNRNGGNQEDRFIIRI